jgi:hypothetical protein
MVDVRDPYYKAAGKKRRKAARTLMKRAKERKADLTPDELIQIAYVDINAVIQPLMYGPESDAVNAARRAYGSLQMLRQFARRGVERQKPKPEPDPDTVDIEEMIDKMKAT